MRSITFLSDFGLEDGFVGICHGVMRRIAPDATVIDVTHGVRPQAVVQGAVVLARSIPYMPVGVHLAVVDPGVGSDRRPIAVRTRSDRIFVGPDNGLLLLAAEQEGLDSARLLSNPRYHLATVSQTFQARDLFAPVAAHLAAGVDFGELGDELSISELVRIELPTPEIGASAIAGHVLDVDRFGNLALNVTRKQLAELGIALGDTVELQLGLERHGVRVGATYADVSSGELVLYEDSFGAVAIAVRDGDAAQLIGAGPGDRVRIGIVERS